jgi:hypothetical protein
LTRGVKGVDLNSAMLRLQSAPTRAQDWINQNKIEYGIKYLLDPLIEINLSEDRSMSFTYSWVLEDDGFLKMSIVNQHERARSLEKGWGKFDVYPKGKENGGADVLRFEIGEYPNAEVVFATEAHPKGFEGYQTLRKAREQGVFLNFFTELIDGASEHLENVRMH